MLSFSMVLYQLGVILKDKYLTLNLLNKLQMILIMDSSF